MTREQHKVYAHGKFALLNIEGTVSKSEMKVFVEGWMNAVDEIAKMKRETVNQEKDTARTHADT